MRVPSTLLFVLGILGLGLLAAMPFRHQKVDRHCSGHKDVQNVLQLRAPVPLQVSPVPTETLLDAFEPTQENTNTKTVPLRRAEIRAGDEIDRARMAPTFSLPAPSRFYAAQNTASDDSRLAPSSEILSVHHVIHDGETLQSIATKYYGDAQQAHKIYEANQEHLPAPDLLPLGLEIIIPGAVPQEIP